MALLHVDFFSDVLGMCQQMDVILPEQHPRPDRHGGRSREKANTPCCICCTA